MIGYNITQLTNMAGGGTTATMRKKLNESNIAPLHTYSVGSRSYAVYGEDAAVLAKKYGDAKKAREDKKLKAAVKTVSATSGTVSNILLEKLEVIEQQLQALHALTSKLVTAYDMPAFAAFPETEAHR